MIGKRKGAEALRNHGVLLSLFLLLAVAAACGTPAPAVTMSPLSTDSPLPAPAVEAATGSAAERSAAERSGAELPAPAPGTATVAGQIYTSTGNGPIPGTFFYLYRLAPGETGLSAVIGSARADRGDVSGQTDGEGRFTLTNVAPGDYYLAVWAPLSWLFVPGPRGEAEPRLFTVKADEVLDLGRLELSWP